MTDYDKFINAIDSILILGKMYNLPTISESGKPVLKEYTDSLIELYTKLYKQING